MIDDPVIRPFADWLREQQSGRTHDELSQNLRDLVSAVVDTGKKGTLTLQITVAPFDRAEGDALIVSDAVKLSLPQHDRRKSIFHADKHHNLTKDDPAALPFDSLREVPAPRLTDTEAHPKEQHA
ncbi:hypothetical protein SAMN05216184_104125 [Georgenia satyanarayanai]|uniref:Uncharacterized protein n=1 Tax=Georgenia satyanarayanai TaxID=860221 RepID=A0A2Y9BX92_9MICO|nr:hypothetical protein [Georgenia satyanarayanai]PYG00186.1 hypothetical protein A8987_104125 [Georgenia satyanarayanai]SSA40422.1 hypothetical protein SAMN05216184_104125 [Georgenia satyanarayanai]